MPTPDFSRLPIAPWHVDPDDPDRVIDDIDLPVADCTTRSGVGDAERAAFIALSRNAEDVMMRRGWSPLKSPMDESWRVDTDDGYYFAFGREEEPGAVPASWPHPFVALVEADAWYAEHIDNAR